ncbi:hypothetical protein GNI_030410, partial [Gregarina niphandrodes]
DPSITAFMAAYDPTLDDQYDWELKSAGKEQPVSSQVPVAVNAPLTLNHAPPVAPPAPQSSLPTFTLFSKTKEEPANIFARK